jgi:branched-chain amino acid transport system substrate-binding protein
MLMVSSSNYIAVLLVVCLLSLLSGIVYTSASTIVFGQSAVLSGSSSSLGLNMQAGISAAFQEVNDLGGINGQKLELYTLDDAYEPTNTIPNTQHMLQNSTIFGLIGYVM